MLTHRSDRQVFDELAIDFSDRLIPALAEKLQNLELIEKSDDDAWYMPFAVHISWCEMCAD